MADETPSTADGIEVRPIRDDEFERARALHNRFTAQSMPSEEMRPWYADTPELFAGAFDADEMVGVVTGRQADQTHAHLFGLGVMPNYRRQGIGAELVAAFEAGAANLGVDRVSVGSAGGYVDRFYAAQGYEPWTVLVRTPAEDEPVPPDGAYDVVEERAEDGVRKRYVDAEGADFDFAEEVGDAFGDDEAVFIMEKPLDD